MTDSQVQEVLKSFWDKPLVKSRLDPKERVQASRIRLLRTKPIHAGILLCQRLKEVTDLTHQVTFDVDGRTLRFNTELVVRMTDSELDWIMVHEGDHILLKHHLRALRRGLSDPETWNVAGDLAINHLHRNDNGALTDYCLFAGEGQFRDLPTGQTLEFYYAKLKEREENERQQQQQGPSGSDDQDQGECDGDSRPTDSSSSDQPGSEGDGGVDAEPAGQQDHTGGSADGGPSDGSGDQHAGEPSNGSASGCSDGRDPEDPAGGSGKGGTSPDGEAPDLTPSTSFGTFSPYPLEDGESIEQAEEEHRMQVVKAYLDALDKDAGSVPGYIKTLVEEVVGVAQIPWQQALRNFCAVTTRNGYSFARPNRRSAHRRDCILPSRYSKGLDHVLVVVDTSASMSQAECNIIFPELDGICRESVEQVTLWQFDTRVIPKKTYLKHELPLSTEGWTWDGRGGTSLLPVWEKVKTMRPRPDVVVLLTDGGVFDGWGTPTGIPTFFLMTTEVVPPWGVCARVNP